MKYNNSTLKSLKIYYYNYSTNLRLRSKIIIYNKPQLNNKIFINK